MNKKFFKRTLIIAVILGIVVAFKIFNLGDYFTLSYIKASQYRFEVLYKEVINGQL